MGFIPHLLHLVYSVSVSPLACGTIVSWPGVKPMPAAVTVRSLSCWSAREVPISFFFFFKCLLNPLHCFLRLLSGHNPQFLRTLIEKYFILVFKMHCNLPHLFSHFYFAKERHTPSKIQVTSCSLHSQIHCLYLGLQGAHLWVSASLSSHAPYHE